MKIVITGSRDWDDGKYILARLWQLPDDSVIHQGEAAGADTLAKNAALVLNHIVRSHPALWALHGKAAGIIRNCEMLKTKPDLVIAFRRGGLASRGTTHCIEEARAMGIPVEIHEYEQRGYVRAPGGISPTELINHRPLSVSRSELGS